MNKSIYCNIQIDGLWLESELRNGYIVFETNADAYVEIERIS